MSLISNDKTPDSVAPDTRRRLERRAEVVKSRLLRHIDALDERRHQVTDLGHQAKELGHKVKELGQKAKEVGKRYVGVAVGGTLLVGGIVGFAVWGIRRRRNRRIENRIARALAPLQRTARQTRPARPSLFSEAARRAVLTFIPIVMAQVSNRVAKRALPTTKEKHLERRLERGAV